MSMLLASRLLPSVGSSTPMTMYENNNINRSHPINSSSTLAPPTSLPSYFSVPFAIQHGYFRCIRYLLQLNYDPNERDGQLRTPLVLCAYVENDRWSLSLAQNLLEKGAKVALEDHARRNAMHHACALQRVHLVQLYLSCLDFNIEAKDCEGNTCLHYAAITGNCEIAELLIKSAEKLGIRLDQYANREGCSAAVLALKYGHIECANQITHRDWDEFFVIPRPLSIYETPPTTDDNQTMTTTTLLSSKKKTKPSYNQFLSMKNENRPLTLSFGLLKIIFNDSDTGYSTRLATLCKQQKQIRRHQHSKHKKHEAPQTTTTTINKLDRTKSTIVNGTHHLSTEALVNETQLSNITKERQTSLDSNGNLIHSNRTSPRMKLLMQQHVINKSNSKENNSLFIQKSNSKTQLSIDDLNKPKSNLLKTDPEEMKLKMSTPTIYRQTSNSTLNQSDNNTSTTVTPKFQRPKTAIVRNQHYVNPPPSRLNSPRIKLTNAPLTSAKRKPLLINLIESASNISRQQTIESEVSEYSHPIYATRPISAVVHRSIPRPTNSSACSIREARGAANRFNKPEELFGIRPEELFGSEEHQPKILDPRTANKPNDNSRLKRNQLQKHIWQQDVDKIIELYNIHHSANYRKSAVPPTTTPPVIQIEPVRDASPNPRVRQLSVTKTSTKDTKATTNPKQSTFAVLNIPRRNSLTRPPVKLTNT